MRLITDETWVRIRIALDAGEIAQAGEIAEAALADGDLHVILHRVAAMRRQWLGDSQGAVAHLLKAVALSPEDAEVLTFAAEGLREIGQLDKAIVLFDRALTAAPLGIAAWYGRGLALEAAGALNEARDTFSEVMRLAPHTAPGFAGYATTSAQLGYIHEALENALRAHQLAPSSPVAGLALARCELARGNAPRAIELLKQISHANPNGPVHEEVAVLTLLGDALDNDGRLNEAFAAYAHANARLALAYPQMSTDTSLLARISEIEAVVAQSAWNQPTKQASLVDGPAARHVFLIGYPRSGTTLIEQALASLPDVVTLEESPTLADAEHLLTARGLAQIGELSDFQTQQLVEAYWKAVAHAGVSVNDCTFVDMDPSKSLALPLIARLFPKAKIIVMRRDPRDIVWSCFRRAFIMNTMTSYFISLDRAARHYDAVMRFTERCLDTLPIEAHTIVYETLVRDFDEVTRAMCSFVGVPWSTDIRNFRSTARRGRVKTVSSAQVRGPLFDGSGQWRRYVDKLAPVLPILEPWLLSYHQH